MISTGTRVRQAVKKVGITKRTLFNWIIEDSKFLHLYTQAREFYVDNFIEEVIDAVENVAEDKVSIQKQKLITETKINILEKVFPRRYGRYVTHDHTVELMSERIKRIRAEEEARLGGDKPGISAQKAIDIEPSPPHKQGEEEEQEKT